MSPLSVWYTLGLEMAYLAMAPFIAIKSTQPVRPSVVSSESP